jgi:hypothetical protein
VTLNNYTAGKLEVREVVHMIVGMGCVERVAGCCTLLSSWGTTSEYERQSAFAWIDSNLASLEQAVLC